MQIVHGVEEYIGVVRRTRPSPKPIHIPLTETERRFLLFRIADITATAEAILHHPEPGAHIAPYTREGVTRHVVGMRNALRRDDRELLLSTPLSKAVLIQAIENNPYFAQMHDTDPRLTVAAVRQAEALRMKVAGLLNRKIAKVPLGEGRKRLPC